MTSSAHNQIEHRSRKDVLRRPVLKAASILAVSGLALTGCASGGGDSAGGNTLQVLVIKHPLTKPMEEMQWVSDLEEAADITIEWEEVSADWDQKKPTMLAAGDVPDLIVGTNAGYVPLSGGVFSTPCGSVL